MLKASALEYAAPGRQALLCGDLELPAGTVSVLLGPNGAGKSTLLSLLCGLLTPSAGEVALDGTALAKLPLVERARRLTVLLQQQPLEFAFSAREVIAMGGQPLNLSAPRLEQRISAVARSLDIEALLERNYLTLSGGEAQRVQLGRVLVQRGVETGVILLDEPVSALDLKHQHQALSYLRDLAKEGYAVMAILHDLNLAARYADHVILMQAGQVISSGEVGDVMQPHRLSRLFNVDVQCLWSPEGLPVFHSLSR
ncbi:heme ABC transporter ATP-binding protein [Marinobacterium litorale]|uniref:heme ABC transporter ATP-binding protein n=1 Tax=Marinobacterium litorale TaxID=404770 RepID=UPI00041941C1|nr:heme ABC transporter ATP-binding protein [Marinobacterium litorale]